MTLLLYPIDDGTSLKLPYVSAVEMNGTTVYFTVTSDVNATFSYSICDVGVNSQADEFTPSYNYSNTIRADIPKRIEVEYEIAISSIDSNGLYLGTRVQRFSLPASSESNGTLLACLAPTIYNVTISDTNAEYIVNVEAWPDAYTYHWSLENNSSTLAYWGSAYDGDNLLQLYVSDRMTASGDLVVTATEVNCSNTFNTSMTIGIPAGSLAPLY